MEKRIAGRYVFGNFFYPLQDASTATAMRICFDRKADKLLALQLEEQEMNLPREEVFRYIERVLCTTHYTAMYVPEAYGFDASDIVPDWAESCINKGAYYIASDNNNVTPDDSAEQHEALKIVEQVCKNFSGGGIYSVGALAAIRAMAHHWKDHLAEGHSPLIFSEDLDETRKLMEVMRAEIMRLVLDPQIA